MEAVIEVEKTKKTSAHVPIPTKQKPSTNIEIEHSYKRSECVENVERELNDAFNEFQFENNTKDGNDTNGEHSESFYGSITNLDMEGNTMETIHMYENTKDTVLHNEDKDGSVDTIATTQLNSLEIVSNAGDVHSDNGISNIEHNNIENGKKNSMKLKLNNSNEYLQLIFSPSPPCDDVSISEDLKNIKDCTEVANEIKENNTKENLVDEKPHLIQYDEEEDEEYDNEDIYDIVNIKKEIMIRKGNKQRLLSTTSVDSFNETLKDYVIPNLPCDNIEVINEIRNKTKIIETSPERSDIVTIATNETFNSEDKSLNSYDCVDGIDQGEEAFTGSNTSIVPDIGEIATPNEFGSSNNETEHTPSVPSNVTSAQSNLEFNTNVPSTIIEPNYYTPSVPSVPFLEDNEIDTDNGDIRIENIKQVFDVIKNEEEFIPLNQEQLDSFYRNLELEEVDNFITDFIDAELNSGYILKHPLYELLNSYLNSKKQVTLNTLQLESSKANLKKIENKIWTFEKAVVSENGECQDGNPVSASHTYQVAKLDRSKHEELTYTLIRISELVTETYTNNLYMCQLDKLKIEDYLTTIKEQFSNIPHNAPTSLYEPHLISQEMHQSVYQLKCTISVLFSFQRRNIQDAEFITQTREWLEKLVSLLLKISTLREHLFLLCHVMRCPSGIHHWAVQYIQVPSLPYNSTCNIAHVNHMITLLSIITSPVPFREQFINKENQESDEHWVMIDSDEEFDDDNEDNVTLLREKDIIALVNQIPIDVLIKQLLCIRQINNNNIFEEINEHHLLQVLSICNYIIKILYHGIQNYKKYKQLNKRLARLYIHIIQYLTDYMYIYIKDNKMGINLKQINIEYNSIILNCIKNLFSINENYVWFYLPQISFELTNSHTCWSILNYLFKNNTNEKTFNINNLNTDYLYELNDELSIYLLNTINNLITNSDNHELINTILQYFLYIGYFNSNLNTKYNKQCENFIVNIVNNNNHNNNNSLISFILNEIKVNIDTINNDNGKYILYLFNYIQIYNNNYIPNNNDLIILSNWLINLNITNKLNNLSRFILSKLNYNNVEHAIQINICLAINKAWLKHTPDIVNSNTSSVTSYITDIMKPVNNEQIFNQWCWQLVCKLKLHLFDQNINNIIFNLNNFVYYLNSLPNIESTTDENMIILSNCIQSNQSLSAYVTLLITNIGHSLPVINEKAWDLINILINNYKYNGVVNILQHVIPLFINNRNLLVNNYKFLKIIINLLNADRVYLKLFKIQIFSNFPGPILQHLSNMIHYQLNNYTTYNFNSNKELIILWVEVVCNVYKEDDVSCAYLLDNILQYCLFDETLKVDIKQLFINLIHTLPNKNMNTGISSLVNWVSSSSQVVQNHTLLTKSLNNYANFEFFTLLCFEIEEELLQNKTGLWTALLIELNNFSGRTNIDNSLKKVCNQLKINTIPSHNLLIYRYAQYILDLPVNTSHLSVIIIQRFFLLYLMRNDTICVGFKFFDGKTNNYIRKLKSKLSEYISHYDKIINDLISNDNSNENTNAMKIFYNNINSLYKSFVLWLEEPRLQEPCLYIPALPYSYNPNRLSMIINNDKTVWYDFINYDDINNEHKKYIQELYKTQNRTEINIKQSPTRENKIINHKDQIIKLLTSYENSKKIKKYNNKNNHKLIINNINKELFLNKDIMLSALNNNFKMIIEYSEAYKVQIYENKSLNKIYKDMIKQLYNDVSNEIVLNAACDVETINNSKQQSSSHYLNCAGAAVIRIQNIESKLNKSIEHIIKQNRIEYDCLLKQLLIPPPSNISLSTLYIHHFINILIKEYNEIKIIGDYKLTNTIKQSSIHLFYEFINIFIQHEYIYLPIVYIFKQYISVIGDTFINDTENECYNILKIMIANHNNEKLYEMLYKHYVPIHSTADKYIEMYDSIANIINMKQSISSNIIYNLLYKFNINDWLINKKPKLFERTKIINIILNTLSNLHYESWDQGDDDDVEHKLNIYKLYRHHLCSILYYEFPEHYGEILNLILKYSENESLSVDIWYDIINVLLYGNYDIPLDNVGVTSSSSVQQDNNSKQYIRPGLPVILLRDLIRRYAIEQRNLSLYDLQGTATLLGNHFIKERLQYGLYGLYPKYKNYVEVIGIFLGMISHALVVQTLYQCKGLVADKLSEQLWPIITNVYSPWILPYLTSQLTEPTAPWIQQLTEDRSILYPWIQADVPAANKVFVMFIETMKFMLDMLPASTNIYSFIWHFYVTNYTHNTLKEHIYSVVHSNLIMLQWIKFLPTLYDLELMLKLVDQYLPHCHTFLSQVFIQIQWYNVIQKYNQSDSISTKIHSTLLNLLIKLSNEPNIRQSNKITPLLLEAQQYSWHLIDANCYEHVTNWFVMSYDPHVILQMNIDNYCSSIDLAALDLLQVTAGYVANLSSYHSTTSRKRQIFVRACVRMTLQLATKYKNTVQAKQGDVKQAISKMIDKVETIISSSVPEQLRTYESGLLLSELLTLLNQSNSLISKLSLEVFTDWLKERTNKSVVLCGILKICGTVVKNDEALGLILETCIYSWFNNSDDDIPSTTTYNDWTKLLTIFQKIPPKSQPIEDLLISNNYILTLYTILVKSLPNNTSDVSHSAAILSKLINCIQKIVPNEHLDETKLPILWSLFVKLCNIGCQESNTAVQSLNILIIHLNSFFNFKQSWQLLHAIGIMKQTVVSNKCRVLCKALTAYILVQMPERIEGENSPTINSQYLRLKSNDVGHIASNSTEFVPSGEALKCVSQLESLLQDKNYADLKLTIESALVWIRSADNSLHNCTDFIVTLAKQLYTERYIHCLPLNIDDPV